MTVSSAGVEPRESVGQLRAGAGPAGPAVRPAGRVASRDRRRAGPAEPGRHRRHARPAGWSGTRCWRCAGTTSPAERGRAATVHRPAGPGRRQQPLHRPDRADRPGRRAAAAGLAGAGRPAVLPGHPGRAGRCDQPAAPEHQRPDGDRHPGRGARPGRLHRGRPGHRDGVRRRRADAVVERRPGPAGCATSWPPSRPSRTGSSGPSCPACWWCRAARAPARPWWRCTGRPTCCTPTGNGWPAPGCWWSGRTTGSWTTSPRCCPAWARPGWCWPAPVSSIRGWTRGPTSPPPRSRSRAMPGWSGCWPPRSGPGSGCRERPIELHGGGQPDRAPAGRGRSRPGSVPSTPASRTTRPGSGSSPTWCGGWRCQLARVRGVEFDEDAGPS